MIDHGPPERAKTRQGPGRGCLVLSGTDVVGQFGEEAVAVRLEGVDEEEPPSGERGSPS